MFDFKLLLLKFYKKLPTLFFDILAIPLAWYGAYWLRYNLQPFSVSHTVITLMTVLTIQVACYYYFKVYKGLWRFASMNDALRIVKSVACAVLLFIPILHLSLLLPYIPRSIIPLYAMLLVSFLCGARFVRRVFFEGGVLPARLSEVQRVLIIGAGQAGESLVRDLKRTSNLCPIGFLDDNPERRGMEIHGVAVLGSVPELSKIVVTHRIDLIFIAIAVARSAEMRRIVGYCEDSGIPFRTLPTLSMLASGKVELNALRKVNLEDLLGRDLVQLQWDKIVESIQDKRVLVTGGGGSIGSELCRQIMALKPQELLIIDHSEYSLYNIELELRASYPEVPFKIALLSVTDAKGIDVCLAEFKPHLVFHAAAYKHVPMLEEQVRVAVLNNVIGTQIIAEASVRYAVEKFVLISTDKAVNPTNVMGATKRVAEIFCQNFNGHVATQFITVRFGNVLGSAGSVVPLFQKQIQAGGPVTVTHPEMMRYFMTIPEACQLILQAMACGVGGEIFVLDMGEPVKISYLAEQMIKLAGRALGDDIEIQYTGLRPGEKLFEELFHESEQLVATEYEKLLKAQIRYVEWSQLLETIRLLGDACQAHQNQEIYILLKSLVPEFGSLDDRRDSTLGVNSSMVNFEPTAFTLGSSNQISPNNISLTL